MASLEEVLFLERHADKMTMWDIGPPTAFFLMKYLHNVLGYGFIWSWMCLKESDDITWIKRQAVILLRQKLHM